MSTTIYMRPLGRLWALACQAHMSVALDGNNCYVASFFRSQAASSSHPFAFLPPSPNTSPHTNGGFSPSSSLRTPPHRFFLAKQSKSRAKGQECKRAAATMDSSSRRRSSPPLLLLPEDLIIRILLFHLED